LGASFTTFIRPRGSAEAEPARFEECRWCVAFNVRRRRAAQGGIVASGCFHDSPDRVDNDFWLVDRHDVTGFLRDDQTSSF